MRAQRRLRLLLLLAVLGVVLALASGEDGALAGAPEGVVETAEEAAEEAGPPPPEARPRASVATRRRRTTTRRVPFGMQRVTGGPFIMGCDGSGDVRCASEEGPARQVTLSDFVIDRVEVPVHLYGSCVASGQCTPPVAYDAASAAASGCLWQRPGYAQHPVNCVTWFQAAAFCAWQGKRLPSEAEWEKAGRWTDGRTYPWGEEAPTCERAIMQAEARDPNTAGCRERMPHPMGTRPQGGSRYGVQNLAGNLQEWVEDIYEAGYYRQGPTTDPLGPDLNPQPGEFQPQRVARGGSYESTADGLRLTRRDHFNPGYASARIGFRCAQSLKQ